MAPAWVNRLFFFSVLMFAIIHLLPLNGQSQDFCEDILRFVETNNICEDQDSCRDRCGAVSKNPPDVTRSICRCDFQCLAYADCCADFSEQCHEEYSKSDLLPDLKLSIPVCAIGNGFKYLDRRERYAIMTTTWPSTSTMRTTDAGNEKGFLSHIVAAINTFRVQDKLTGIVYGNIESFLRMVGDMERFDFVPNCIELFDRSYTVLGKAIETYVEEISNLRLSWREGEPRAPRPCVFDQTYIHCPTCPKRWKTAYTNWPCFKLSTTKFTAKNTRPHFNMSRVNVEVDSLKDMITQVDNCFIYHVKPITTYPFEQCDIRIQPFSQDLKNYTLNVELNGLPWRKLECNSPFIPLDQCQVIECAEPAFLASDHSLSFCILPTSVQIVFTRRNPHVQINSAVNSQYKEEKDNEEQLSKSAMVCSCIHFRNSFDKLTRRVGYNTNSEPFSIGGNFCSFKMDLFHNILVNGGTQEEFLITKAFLTQLTKSHNAACLKNDTLVEAYFVGPIINEKFLYNQYSVRFWHNDFDLSPSPNSNTNSSPTSNRERRLKLIIALGFLTVWLQA